jgi:hypothetical protein
MNVAVAMHQKDVSRRNLLPQLDEVLESGNIKRVLEEINEKEHLDNGLKRTIETIAEYLD